MFRVDLFSSGLLNIAAWLIAWPL